jgi:hypothetical protein
VRAAAGTNGSTRVDPTEGIRGRVPPAERLIEALSHAGLTDIDRLAAYRGVLSLVMLPAQVELAGPLAADDPEQSDAMAAKRIDGLAGSEHPHMAALAETSQRSTLAADFDRALDMLLAGIKGRTDSS